MSETYSARSSSLLLGRRYSHRRATGHRDDEGPRVEVVEQDVHPIDRGHLTRDEHVDALTVLDRVPTDPAGFLRLTARMHVERRESVVQLLRVAGRDPQIVVGRENRDPDRDERAATDEQDATPLPASARKKSASSNSMARVSPRGLATASALARARARPPDVDEKNEESPFDPNAVFITDAAE